MSLPKPRVEQDEPAVSPAGITRPPRGKSTGWLSTTAKSRPLTVNARPASLERWHRRYAQLNLFHVLLDAIDDSDQTRAERAVREIGALTGVKIELPRPA